MQKKTKAPHTFKDNFWSKQRVEKGMTIKEIAQLLGRCETQVGMYFSGQQMPNDTVIRELCDLFDVDFNTGNLEFQHAHRNWKAEHKATLVSSAKTVTPKSEELEPVMADERRTVQTAPAPTFVKDRVLDLLYGKVDRCVYKLIEDLLDKV